jgi:hypothetical protein
MSDSTIQPTKSSTVVLVFAWIAVGLPLLWGVIATLKKALALFS